MAYEVLINYLCIFHRGERVVSQGEVRCLIENVRCNTDKRGALYSTDRRRPRSPEPDARGARRPPALAAQLPPDVHNSSTAKLPNSWNKPIA